MSRYYVTFGGAGYDNSTKLLLAGAAQFGGAITPRIYDDLWLIQSGFVAKHKWLWESNYKPVGINVANHGFGHCSWKPYILFDTMQHVPEDSLILYTDADAYPIANLDPLFEMCDRDGMVLFEEQGCINRKWIKRDCFIAMGCDEPKYWDAKHGCGRFQLFKNTLFSRAFVKSWADHAVMPRCQRHDAGGCQNLPEFTRHSTEQAILTLLAHKNNIPLHRTPDQNGWPHSPNCGQTGDEYVQLFKHEWCEGDKQMLTGSRFRNV